MRFKVDFKSAEENKVNEEKELNKEKEKEKNKSDDSSKNILELKNVADNKKDGEKITFGLFMTFVRYSGGISFLVQLAVTNIIWQISQIYREYYVTMWSSLTNITKSENNWKIVCFILITIPGIISVYYRQIFMMKGFIK